MKFFYPKIKKSHMQINKLALALGTAALLCSGSAFSSELSTPAAQATPVAPQKAQGVRSQNVIDRISEMGESLRELRTFTLQMDTTTDVIVDNNQKIKTSATKNIYIIGSNHLRLDIDGEFLKRNYYFDGSHFSLYTPGLGYYTTIPFEGTSDELLNHLIAQFNLKLPLEDLFMLGKDQASLDSIESAAYIATVKINDKRCDHVAFRQGKKNWQLWISWGEKPMPCKMVVTSTEEAVQPEYSAVFAWNKLPNQPRSGFTFHPKKQDMKVELTKEAESLVK